MFIKLPCEKFIFFEGWMMCVEWSKNCERYDDDNNEEDDDNDMAYKRKKIIHFSWLLLANKMFVYSRDDGRQDVQYQSIYIGR